MYKEHIVWCHYNVKGLLSGVSTPGRVYPLQAGFSRDTRQNIPPRLKSSNIGQSNHRGDKGKDINSSCIEEDNGKPHMYFTKKSMIGTIEWRSIECQKMGPSGQKALNKQQRITHRTAWCECDYTKSFGPLNSDIAIRKKISKAAKPSLLNELENVQSIKKGKQDIVKMEKHCFKRLCLREWWT